MLKLPTITCEADETGQREIQEKFIAVVKADLIFCIGADGATSQHAVQYMCSK